VDLEKLFAIAAQEMDSGVNQRQKSHTVVRCYVTGEVLGQDAHQMYLSRRNNGSGGPGGGTYTL
jgi:hypothetical protein